MWLTIARQADIRTRNEPGPDTAGKEVAASEVNDLLALESHGSSRFELDVVPRILLIRLSTQDRREVGVVARELLSLDCCALSQRAR